MSGEDQGPIDEFDRLYADRTPDATLQKRVWREWRGSKESGPSGRIAGANVWLRIAAGFVLFATGWAVRAALDGPRAPSNDATAYMLMLWQSPGFGDEAPEEVARRYAGWAREVATSGVAVRGDELSDVDRAVIGEPDEGSGGFISGYFLVDANGLAEASDLAESHPHLERGGWIEVSRVVRR